MFLKEYCCKHITGLAIKLLSKQLVNLPKKAISLPIDKLRASDRPCKANTALTCIPAYSQSQTLKETLFTQQQPSTSVAAAAADELDQEEEEEEAVIDRRSAKRQHCPQLYVPVVGLKNHERACDLNPNKPISNTRK